MKGSVVFFKIHVVIFLKTVTVEIVDIYTRRKTDTFVPPGFG